MRTNLIDQVFMRRALRLAERGRSVSPNPKVGCVIVRDGRIVGEGFHSRFGGPHAEIEALKNAGQLARGATAYVTLEPCAHFGKTPPCVPALVKAGVRSVVAAMRDPNPLVAGKGFRVLKKAGIRILTDVLKEEAVALNRPFITAMTRKRPYVVLKWAMTADGKTATARGESKWITSDLSRKRAHRMRAEADAVVVGVGTVLADDPELTSHGTGRNPKRIILDPKLRTPLNARVVRSRDAETFIVCSDRIAGRRLDPYQKKGVQFLRTGLKFNQIDLLTLSNFLIEMNIHQLFIEGGSETGWRFLKSGLVDEIRLFIAPVLLGGRRAFTGIGGAGFPRIRAARRFQWTEMEAIGPDVLLTGVMS